MKKSIKLSAILLSVLGMGLFQNANAQTADDSQAWRLGVSVNPGVATKDPYGFVIGGDIRLQKDFVGPLSWTLGTGFTHFGLKDDFKDLPGVESYNVIPVKTGIKAYVSPHFYVGGEVGAGFATSGGAGTSFVWSPSIGYSFNNGLDLGVKYEDYTKYSNTKQVALRVAYGFNLSK